MAPVVLLSLLVHAALIKGIVKGCMWHIYTQYNVVQILLGSLCALPIHDQHGYLVVEGQESGLT